MSLNSKSKYPSERAYVLKLRSDAKPNALAGRLEHLVSGRQCEFASGPQLLDWLLGELDACPANAKP